jgi:Zn-dependent protease with chaperone function
MQQTVTTLRTGKEKTYGALMIGFGALLWVAIIAAAGAGLTNPKTAPVIGVYIGYAVAIWLFIVIAAYRATAFGNMILLGPKQFPTLHAMVVAGSNEIGLSEPPKTFLYNSNGIFNAFARRLRGGRYVFLTSALVDADSDAQVRFVIGHELGHHAAGHLNP